MASSSKDIMLGKIITLAIKEVRTSRSLFSGLNEPKFWSEYIVRWVREVLTSLDSIRESRNK